MKVNFIIIAYRGYSNSEGVANEKGLMHDSHAIMEYVSHQKDIDTSQIFIQGRSLGGAVVIYGLSSRSYKVKGVILENTFSSMSSMVDIVFPMVSFLKGLVLRNWWDSTKRIGEISHPILFVKAENDELVPPRMMDELYNLAENSKMKTMYEIKGAGHNGSWQHNPNEYFKTVRQLSLIHI